MEKHEDFTEWAVKKGVKINGVSAHKFEGRGLGIVADKKLQPNTTIIRVPISALRTVHTVPKAISTPIGPITVHGVLAADLSLNTTSNIAPWTAVLPSYASFQESMPMLWSPPLQSLLPPAAASLVSNQHTKLKNDWAAVHAAFPDLDYDTYLHNWLIVNTRTFYFVRPSTKTKDIPSNRDDCMALNPFADYFNHTSTSAATCCSVSFDASGYSIMTPSSGAIAKGSEIHISYGAHTNDFLLAEYGFIMSDNEHDNIALDDLILPLFSPEQKEKLSDHEFLGEYVLDNNSELCYRTQVALRLLCTPARKWERIANGLDSADQSQDKVDVILLPVLSRYQDTVLSAIAKVSSLGESEQIGTLIRRWKQINALLQSAIDRIQS